MYYLSKYIQLDWNAKLRFIYILDEDMIICNRIHHEGFLSSINDALNIVTNMPIDEAPDYGTLALKEKWRYSWKQIKE